MGILEDDFRIIVRLNNALNKLEKTISEYQESEARKRQVKPQTEFRAVVTLPVEVSKYYESEERERPVTNKREKFRTCLEVVGVGAAIILAFLTLLSLRTLNGQLYQARRQNNDIETQFREQQRPWVGLSGNVEFPKQPIFRVYSAAPSRTEVDVAIIIRLKNVGISPSFNSTAKLTVLPMANIATVEQFPQFEMSSTCDLADQEKEGSVLFPGSDITMEFDTLSRHPIELSHIGRLWILGCIAYRSGGEGPFIVRHHTRFWIMSYLLDSSHPTPVKKLNILTMFTVPVRGWQMVKTEAD
jgi:hypothetical protein